MRMGLTRPHRQDRIEQQHPCRAQLSGNRASDG